MTLDDLQRSSQGHMTIEHIYRNSYELFQLVLWPWMIVEFSKVSLYECFHLFVCLWTRYLEKLPTDFHEILWRGAVWDKEEVIWFWWWSGSASGSRIFFKGFFIVGRYGEPRQLSMYPTTWWMDFCEILRRWARDQMKIFWYWCGSRIFL